jgi:hypothetical protein
MESIGKDQLQAIIPGKELSLRWDLQYYFEVLTDTRGRMWPDWEHEQPFYVVKVNPVR